MDAHDQDCSNLRKVFINGFSPGSILESELSDYFGLLFDGHVRGVWIDRKFGTHALVEFDEKEWADRAIQMRKHYIGEDRMVVFAWVCTRGRFSKQNRQRHNSIESEESIAASDSGISSLDGDNNGLHENISITGIYRHCESLMIDEHECAQREAVRKELETKLMEIGIWPVNTKVALFGSSVSGFGWKSSDIDFTLLIDSDHSQDRISWIDQADDSKRLTVEEFGKLDSRAHLEILASCLRDIDPCRVSNIIQIPGHRCPLIRFTFRHESTSCHCEISVENYHAMENTLWLRWLCWKWKWLSMLYSIFRLWLRRWDSLERRKKSTMNGYSMALLVIAYCQKRRLIDLKYEKNDKATKETMPNEHGLNMASIMATFNDLINYLANSRLKQTVFTPSLSENEESIVSLFSFYSSGRCNDSFQFNSLNVQDPFDFTHNTASTVSDGNVKRIQEQCQYWIKETQRIGMEEAWKTIATSIRPVVVDSDNGANDGHPAFICEPSWEAVRTILSFNKDCEPDECGKKWCHNALEAIVDVFSNVLKLRIAEENGSSTTNECRYHCLAWVSTWLIDKRRSALQKLLDDKEFGIGVRSRYVIEEKISDMLVAEESRGGKKKKKARIEPVGEFSLIVHVTCEGEYQEILGRLSGDKHCAVFSRFLQEFFDLVFDDAMRKVLAKELQ